MTLSSHPALAAQLARNIPLKLQVDVTLPEAQGGWFSAIASIAQREAQVFQWRPLDGYSYFIEAKFIFARPKSLPKYVMLHGKEPDLSQQLYATIRPALASIIYTNPAQVDLWSVGKEYADEGDTCGLRITISRKAVKEAKA